MKYCNICIYSCIPNTTEKDAIIYTFQKYEAWIFQCFWNAYIRNYAEILKFTCISLHDRNGLNVS